MADSIRVARDFTTDVQDELKKVTWPDWPQLKSTTLVVLVFTVILVVLIAVIDFLVRLGLDGVASVFGG